MFEPHAHAIHEATAADVDALVQTRVSMFREPGPGPEAARLSFRGRDDEMEWGLAPERATEET